MAAKYKIHEFAKDFEMKSNAVIELMTKLDDTPRKSSAARATSLVMVPSYLIWAKSRTLRRNRLAIRGVPLDLRAISAAPSSSICTPSTPAERRMIVRSSSSV